MPQKRRRRRPLQGHSRRRLDEDGASLSESLVDSDSSSRVDGGSPPPGFPDDELLMSSTEPRYHQIIASRLAQLQLPDSADISDLDGCSNLPSSEILEALTPKSFHDDDLRAALLEYQCQNLLSEIRGPDFMGLDTEDSGESEPDDLVRDEKYTRAREVLVARMPDIDTYTRLDQEQTNKVYFKHALYRIRAALLLKGKPVDELDDAAFERKYPAELILEKDCFCHYVTDGYFGWDFDSDLFGHKKYLTDYQRLVLLNGDGGDEYTSWKKYRPFYSTPEADRDYLQYWEMIVKKIKWLKKYVLPYESSSEWDQVHSKAGIQAVRIAAEFPHMTMELAAVGFNEYIWNTRTYVLSVKDLDGIFYEIWRRLHVGNQGFRDALRQVYGERLFPAQNRNMECGLKFGDSRMDLLFRQCTEGLTKDVPKSRARELIAQEIRWRYGFAGTYEQYARKKLKIAELLGLISMDKMA